MVAIKDIEKTELFWPYNIGCEHVTFINVVHYMKARYGEDYYSGGDDGDDDNSDGDDDDE